MFIEYNIISFILQFVWIFAIELQYWNKYFLKIQKINTLIVFFRKIWLCKLWSNIKPFAYFTLSEFFHWKKFEGYLLYKIWNMLIDIVTLKNFDYQNLSKLFLQSLNLSLRSFISWPATRKSFQTYRVNLFSKISNF